ncbi:UDP-N-acetylmuramate--L-alanine ligase [Anaerotalea alkaliphila]|uniref:UDP-N-acetylmuramate--L-alanine ligase n=1 Tax=Anaerotalea alkaliphila TaxID=2662126 RepID=A0A7X5HU69_9FIRM|nr:UDP-N-acetylmuramate--L-alanine ligase [Anaerotalea alkaliphila]NDL66733.1 UDP-N-acetylmuramate--L-alanine ligase [Anaerotalea alkaliphila]
MYKIDLFTPIHVHFIGIGGISMSGLAQILLGRGFQVSGSDMTRSKTTDHLQELGALVRIGHRTSNIHRGLDLVVYTAAIAMDNAELAAALELGIPAIDRAELLGQLMDQYEQAIAVSGTHGKTTTTSMISQILLAAQKDPTISVGAMLQSIGGNIRVGRSGYFITEACEYHNSFLKFNPRIAIILNVEEDHLDFFAGLEEIRASFHNFAHRLPPDGHLVINSSIPDYGAIAEPRQYSLTTFGNREEDTYSFRNPVYDALGCATFDLYHLGSFLAPIRLHVPGEHNIYNSLSAIATARILDIDLQTIQEGLEAFRGADRRFEYKGSLMGVTVVDDYAHHPTEILGTLAAAGRMEHKHLWVVFQPHTYSRTKLLFEDFVSALSKAENLIVTDIYAAREANPGNIHAKDLVARIREVNPNCHYLESFDDIEAFLLANCVPGDLLITMGAGNVYLIGEDLLRG